MSEPWHRAQTRQHRASSPATSATSPPGSPPTAGTATRSSPAATGWWSAGPARGPTGRSSCAGCSGWRTCCRWASAGRPTTSAAGRSTSTPAGATRCSASSGCRRRTSPASPATSAGITVPAIVDVPTGQVVTNDFAADHRSTCRRSGAPYHRDGRAGPVPGGAAGRDRRGHAPWSSATSTTASTGAGSPAPRRRTTAAYERLFARLDWLSRPAGRPAVPGRRHDHRGRRPAVHHAGPVRRGLPRPLQVQPAEADRDAGAVGVRPGPVPDAGVRRHDRLRPHQAALLRGAPRHQPDAASCRAVRTCRAGSSPHGREELGGRPFGDGTPPGPPPPGRAVPPGHAPLY